MALDLVLQYLAVAGLIAATTSLAVCGLLRICTAYLSACTAVTRARVLLTAAVLPFLVTCTLVGAALAPMMGWISDHCTEGSVVHLHPHICGHVPAAATPGIVCLLALLFAARVTGVLSVEGSRRVAAIRSEARLFRGSQPLVGGALRLIEMPAPRAFIVGYLRPRVYVSRTLWEGPARAQLRAVLAHERAHLLRRDPLRRSCAAWLSCCHLPWVAGQLLRDLSAAHEHAADELAAERVGSRLRIAEALVQLARAARPSPMPVGALAFAGEAVVHRVELLLGEAATVRQPNRWVLAGLAGFGLGLVAHGAGAVHHGFEQVLGILGLLV